MIKAEIINHEGNPGPNWLDQCRTLVTPGRATALVMVAVAAVLLTTVIKNDADTINTLPKSSASQQPASTPLQVQPLRQSANETADGATTVQSAAGGQATVPGSQDGSASTALGAGNTPALNNAKSVTDVTKKAPAVDQSKLNSQKLTTTVQSTVQTVNDTVNRTRSVINGALGL